MAKRPRYANNHLTFNHLTFNHLTLAYGPRFANNIEQPMCCLSYVSYNI
ncbi:hypothetical protein [Moorena sp. SIO3I8]|nr:hypothetical protein [Moorena sp. SIO3I8]NEO10543.1 hypothetical protein [Moorena sp. SIO3I8]